MVATALLVGSLLGLRHALEADHVAAVASLMDQRGRSLSTGASWGVGHSVPILLLGAIFLLLDLRPPAGLVKWFEAVVAVVLIVLGVRVLADRESLGLTVLRHLHRSRDEPTEKGHLHVSIVGKEVGLTHSHADQASLAVGVVHGLAGSGGIVVVLATAAPTLPTGAAFLLGFSISTIVVMAVAAWGFGRAFGRASTLRIVAGIVSIAIGVYLLAGFFGVGPAL